MEGQRFTRIAPQILSTRGTASLGDEDTLWLIGRRAQGEAWAACPRLLHSRSIAMFWREANTLLSDSNGSGLLAAGNTSSMRSSFVIISHSETASGSGELTVTTIAWNSGV